MATGAQGHRDQVSDGARLLVPSAGRRPRAEGRAKKTFPCPECQKNFNSLEKLKVHSYSHTGERPYRCSHPDCTKAFVSKYKLLRHAATHSPEKNHRCSYCEKTFHRKDHLKNHLHTHDPNKQAFACRHCGKSYNTKLGFKRHLALHAAHSGDLTCQVCLQPFASTAVLLEHLKSHAGKSSGGTKEKKHRCEHCERRFYTRKDVRRHLVVHTGRKDFLCQFCAQRFGRKDHLTRHVKKSHSRELPRVKTEPADSPEPAVSGLASGSMYPGPPEPLPFPLKYPNFTSYAPPPQDHLETYLLELPSSSDQAPHPPVAMLEEPGGVSKMSTAVGAGDPLMDFSQLFNFLPLNMGGSGGQDVAFTPAEESTPPMAPQVPGHPESPTPFMSNLNTPTTLPSFHQAFQ